MIYTLIDHRNDAKKCFKFCGENTRLRRLAVFLKFRTFYDVISMICKSVDHGKLWSNVLCDHLHVNVEGDN